MCRAGNYRQQNKTRFINKPFFESRHRQRRRSSVLPAFMLDLRFGGMTHAIERHLGFILMFFFLFFRISLVWASIWELTEKMYNKFVYYVQDLV